jgi:hypothetical protein
MYADRRTEPTSFGIVRLSNEIKFGSQSHFISDPRPSAGFGSFGKRMGAAGFEPATSWSEAKCSVQAELSALYIWQTNLEIKTPRFVCLVFFLFDIR